MKLIFFILISALTLQVQAANQKPVPVAIANPTTGYLPLEVQLDGSGSYDPDGQVVSYEWKFSGGETLTGQQVSYVFNKNRKDSVRLTVTDNEGKKDSSTLELNFSQDNQAPVISLELPDDFDFRTATPNILVEWEDATSQVDLSRVEFILDGVNVISHVELTAHSGSLQFTSSWPLSPGAHRLKVVVQDFYKNKATRIINFSYSAPIVRPNQLNGVVLDTNKQPLAGVQIISVTGPVASPLSGVTDAQGKYSLPFTVAGDYQLQFLKDGYLSTYKYKTILAGVDDVLPDVFMAVADTKKTLVESSSGGVATNTSGSISLVVPPGSLDMNRELSFTEAVTGKTLQVPLPNGSQFTFAQNNQPSGTQFSSPATMSINNLLGFNPGTEIPVGVTQEGLGVWEDTGFKGIVSADGSKVVFSVSHFSDYDVNLNSNSPEGETQDPSDPETTDNGGNKINDDCNCRNGSRINATTNELYIDYELPSVMRNGKPESIGLTYASLGANPHALLAVSGRGNKQITDPIKVEMITNFAGFNKTTVFEGSAGTKPTTYVEAFKLESPEGYPYGTSAYGYWVHLRSYYNRVYAQTQYFGGPAGLDVEAGGGSRFVREETYLDEYIFDRAVHKNNSYGPYGAGWTIKGVEKLTTSYDGSVVFEDGTGAYTYYLPAVPQAGKRLLQKRVMDSNENLQYHDGYFYGASCASNEVFRVDMLGRYTTLISNSTHREIGLNCPTSVFPARKGGYYIADSGSGRILHLGADRSVRVLANKDKHNISHPTFVTEDNVLAVHFIDGDEVKTISPHDGKILTMISDQEQTYFNFALKKPTQIHFDRNFNLMVLDEELGQLVKFYMNAGRSRVILDDVKGIKSIAHDPIVNRYYILDNKGQIHHWNGYGNKTTVAMDISQGLLKPKFALGSKKSSAPFVTGIAYSPEVGLVYSTQNGLSLRALSVDGKSVDDVYFISPTGNFSNLVKHPDGTFTRTLLDKTVIQYDSAGYITQRLLTNGSSYLYSYDSEHRVTKITLPNGGDYNFSYFNYGLLKQITDPANRATTFTYDDKGNLAGIRNPEGEYQRFTYDLSHLLTSHTDEHDLTTNYFYQYSRVSAIEYPGNRTKEFKSGLIDNLTAPLNQDGYRVRLAPENSKTTEITAGERTSELKLDNYGLYAGMVDGNGNRSFIERNTQGRPTQETSAEGRKLYMSYDNLGRMSTSLDAQGQMSYTYDPVTLKIQNKSDAFGRFTSTSYNQLGLVGSFVDKRSKYTNYGYDSLGNLSYIADMAGNSINFDRDLSGNIIFVKDKAGNQTFMTRDPSGNLESSRDPLGYTTSYDYDQMNRVTKITDPIGGQTLFTYLPTGQLETITDANNHTTSYVYNEQYRVERASNHLGQEVLYTHDKDGNILTKTTKAGENISYAYDGLSKLLSKSFTGDSAQYVYDRDSLLISMSDNDSVVQRSYDRYGRIESEVASHHNAVTSWSYNEVADNTETQVNLGNQGLINIQRQFDQNGNLFSLKARILGQTVNYQKVRNDLNDVTQRTLPNGAVSQITYDANSRMVDMTTSALGGSYMDYRYTANGNISTVFETLNQSAKPYIYEYDSLGRLTKEQTIKNKTYTYDAVGNDTSNGGQYNELNQLIEDNDFLFTYDLNGNQTSKTAKVGGARQEFFWNADSQLIQAKVFKATSTLQYTINYKYDASGRRIERDVVNHLNSAKSYTHKFIYDKEHIVAILDASNQVLAAFVFDEGIDEPVAMVTDYNQDGKMNVLTYVRDRQNSVKMIANEKKEIIQEVFYSAYGETQIVNAGIEKTKLINPFYYTSRELEPELGIYYYRARYYDPSSGRFLSEDPIGFAGGDYNLYRYVTNNPVRFSDPAGFMGLVPGAQPVPVLIPSPLAKVPGNCEPSFWEKIKYVNDTIDQLESEKADLEKGSPEMMQNMKNQEKLLDQLIDTLKGGDSLNFVTAPKA